jgi:hypothetical protein
VVRTTWVARSVGRPFPKLYPCPEVAGSSPADYTNFIQCPGDTWRPCLGHVSPIHSPPRCHVSRNDSTIQLPTVCQLIPATSAYSPATSAYDLPHHRTTLPHQHPYGLYGLYSQHIFFCLFDDLNRTRYLTHPTSV